MLIDLKKTTNLLGRINNQLVKLACFIFKTFLRFCNADACCLHLTKYGQYYHIHC